MLLEHLLLVLALILSWNTVSNPLPCKQGVHYSSENYAVGCETVAFSLQNWMCSAASYRATQAVCCGSSQGQNHTQNSQSQSRMSCSTRVNRKADTDVCGAGGACGVKKLEPRAAVLTGHIQP